MTYNLTGSY